jgi:predicted transcriptional regulator of viral defense system
VQKALKGRFEFGTEKVVRSGVKISVANKERAFADCLDSPEYSGGFEELSKCVEALPFLNLDSVLEYLLLLSKRNLFAKAGYILEKYSNKFFFNKNWEQRFLSERLKSSSIAYLAGRGETGRLVKKWNLIVPEKYYQQEA